MTVWSECTHRINSGVGPSRGVQPPIFFCLKNGLPPTRKGVPINEERENQMGLQERKRGASLVAQWLRICLPMQGTQVRALVWEDPTCRGAAGPVSHNYWACASGACALQWERPQQWEARAPRWRVAPARRNWRKPSHRNEDPTQPKIN